MYYESYQKKRKQPPRKRKRRSFGEWLGQGLLKLVALALTVALLSAALIYALPPALFAANYELRHIASEDALFTTPPVYVEDAGMLRDGVAHIDAAYGGSDYTALTCGQRRGDKLYLYGRLWRGHVDDVLDAALMECQRLMCGPVYVESNGDKGYLAKEIARRGARAGSYWEKENKHTKIAVYLRKWWRDIEWVRGTDREYIGQIMGYSEDAEHDDAADSAACVCRYFDRRRG